MPSNPYESTALLDQYLLFHYGTEEEILPYPDGPKSALNFAERVVSETFALSEVPPKSRALDLGCAVGRSSFALTRHCAEVVGVDYSRRFVEAARVLAREGCLPYRRWDEGELSTPLLARVPDDARPERARFEVGDAMAPSADLGAFDLVLLANLLCRLSDPRACLRRLLGLVKTGGQLVITSPWTWLDDYTPRSQWLGGRETPNGPLVSLRTLRETLEPDFVFHRAADLPMLIREHARKYQWTVSQASVWRRPR